MENPTHNKRHHSSSASLVWVCRTYATRYVTQQTLVVGHDAPAKEERSGGRTAAAARGFAALDRQVETAPLSQWILSLW